MSGNPIITPECLAQLESNIVGTLSGAIIKASDLTVDGGLTGTVKILRTFGQPYMPASRCASSSSVTSR